MRTRLNLCTPDDLSAVKPLVAAFHHEVGIASDDTHLTGALTPILQGSPFGAIYLIGPRRAPLGYVAVTFGWSVRSGGQEARIDEVYVRPPVRRRGLALEALNAIGAMLQGAGVHALHLLADTNDQISMRLYAKAQYKAASDIIIMSHRL